MLSDVENKPMFNAKQPQQMHNTSVAIHLSHRIDLFRILLLLQRVRVSIATAMRDPRKNCVVLDTSILPKRPCILKVQTFLEDQLRLDMSQVKYIQPHNVKSVVYLGMESNEAASRVATSHHLKHFMKVDDKKFAIPIYVENSAVEVRLHDLPYEMENAAIMEHMRQYGEVIAVCHEVWKNYFPGLFNGVRVVRMKLSHPIPSYISINDEITLVSYQHQVKTCRNCGRKSHPKQRCSEASENITPNSSITVASETHSSDNKNTNDSSPESIAADSIQWPTLQKPKPAVQQQKTNTEMKRQRSIDSDTISNDTKKLNANQSDGSERSLTTNSDICPYTQRPYRIPDYLHIADENERRALIEEDKRRIDAAYLEIKLKKQNKKKVPN